MSQPNMHCRAMEALRTVEINTINARLTILQDKLNINILKSRLSRIDDKMKSMSNNLRNVDMLLESHGFRQRKPVAVVALSPHAAGNGMHAACSINAQSKRKNVYCRWVYPKCTRLLGFVHVFNLVINRTASRKKWIIIHWKKHRLVHRLVNSHYNHDLHQQLYRWGLRYPDI